MKAFYFCIVLICCIFPYGNLGAPVESVPQAKVLESKNVLNEDGNYHFSYVLDDGTEYSGNGRLIEVDGNQVYEVKGHFRYVSPDGKVHITRYIADDKGFRTVPNKKNRINPKAIAGILG